MMKGRCRKVSAMVIVLVLWAVALLALLAGGLSFAVRQNLAISNIENDRIVAHWMARAGVERAVAELKDDVTKMDMQRESWGDDEDAFKGVKLIGGSFSVMYGDDRDIPEVRYGVCDENGKLNINSATKEQLMELPNMTAPIASAIIDWRDSNEEPETDGIERSYYAAKVHPYTIRNGMFKTVRELLLVRGVTPELFYGEDLNVNGLLDENENDGANSVPMDNTDGKLDRGWYAYVTVYSYNRNTNVMGNKRLNLKTADAGTISQRLSLESWAADAIVKARNENKLNHLIDLMEVRRDTSDGKAADVKGDMNDRDESEKDYAVTKNMFRQIVDEVTLKDDEVLMGQINVNTAPVTVLKTLPGMDNELASAIDRYRQGGGGFTTIADLLELSSMTKEKFSKMEDFLTVRSSVFMVRSYGQSESVLAGARIECVVDRSEDVPKYFYWLESSP
jgi:DNA uptake protein ComE-like DNA-binding protein